MNNNKKINVTKLPVGLKHLYFYQEGLSGSFMKALFDAIHKADAYNLRLLHKAYPDEVNAFYTWQRFGPRAFENWDLTLVK